MPPTAVLSQLSSMMADHYAKRDVAKPRRRRARVRGKAARGRVSAKIRHLRREGKPPKQAVAMAHSMERAGRLGPRGGYRRKGA